MSSATTFELPVEDLQEFQDDPEVQHWYCEDAPRNIPEATVMCCGTPDRLAGEEIPEGILLYPRCALCELTWELGMCACWA